MNDWERLFLKMPDYGVNSIGQLLRQMRKEAGYSQEEMGLKVRLSRWTIGDIEKDKPEAIEALDALVIRKWKTACSHRIAMNTLTAYKDAVTRYFKLS